MKRMKHLFALLLALVFATGLALPAFAEEEPDPAMPVIIRQPVGGYARVGDSVTFAIEAELPNAGRIGYQWYDAATGMPIADAISGSVSFTFPLTGISAYCVVYNMNDSTPAEGPHRVVSETAAFRQEPIEVSPDSFLGRIAQALMSPFIALINMLTRLGVPNSAANTIANLLLFPLNILLQPVYWLLILSK